MVSQTASLGLFDDHVLSHASWVGFSGNVSCRKFALATATPVLWMLMALQRQDHRVQFRAAAPFCRWLNVRLPCFLKLPTCGKFFSLKIK
jgi:hypothetical protein